MMGVRGAITIEKNNSKYILKATEKLIEEILQQNKIDNSEIVSIIFTATKDLDKVYPARAVRNMGYTDIPLMCYQEMNVNNSLKYCIRAMIYINRDCNRKDINHIYLEKAKSLRPDLIKEED